MTIGFYDSWFSRECCFRFFGVAGEGVFKKVVAAVKIRVGKFTRDGVVPRFRLSEIFFNPASVSSGLGSVKGKVNATKGAGIRGKVIELSFQS